MVSLYIADELATVVNIRKRFIRNFHLVLTAYQNYLRVVRKNMVLTNPDFPPLFSFPLYPDND